MKSKYLRRLGLPFAALFILAPTSRKCGSPDQNTNPQTCFETGEQTLGIPLPRFSIIGENDIELVSDSLTVQDPSIAGTKHIGKMLFWKLSAGSWYQCTVFLVSRNHVLTAAHCGSVVASYTQNPAPVPADGSLDMVIDGTGADAKSAYILFNRLKSDRFRVPAGSPEKFFVEGIAEKLTSINGIRIDVSLLKLSMAANIFTQRMQSAGEIWGYFVYYTNQNFRRPSQLYRAGFGVVTSDPQSPFNGQFMHIDRSKSCQITPACQSYLTATTLQVPDSCDLKKGDSGGPVVDKDTGIVIGVNTAELDDVPINQLTNIAALQYWWDRRAPLGVFDALEDDL